DFHAAPAFSFDFAPVSRKVQYPNSGDSVRDTQTIEHDTHADHGASLNLRQGLLLLAVVQLVVGLVLVSVGVEPAWWLLIQAGILLAALVYERKGYPRDDQPSNTSRPSR